MTSARPMLATMQTANREERDMGMSSSDIYAMHLAAKREVERLTKVIACIDAGTPELPLNLYP